MRTIRLVTTLPMLFLAACQQPLQAPAAGTKVSGGRSPSPATPLPKPSPAPVATLAGSWRIAAIDGRSLDEPYGLALTGDEDRLWWEPGCAGMVRRYKINAEAIAFSPLHPPAPVGSPPRTVCAIGLPARLEDVFRTLDAATTVTRTPQNGIDLAGGGHSVTLFSQ